jgi:hypothetical protein
VKPVAAAAFKGKKTPPPCAKNQWTRGEHRKRYSPCLLATRDAPRRYKFFIAIAPSPRGCVSYAELRAYAEFDFFQNAYRNALK